MRRPRLGKLTAAVVGFVLCIGGAGGTLRTDTAAAEEQPQETLGDIEPQIVNGQDISADVWPQVVYLSITKTLATANPTTLEYGCTGTLLARSTIETARILGTARGDVILTAAHCVAPDEAGRVTTRVAYVRGEGVNVGQSASNPQNWPRNGSYVRSISQHDTALVFFGNHNGFTDGLPICEQQPNVGAQVTLVGFGCTDLNRCPGSGGENSKRRGTNTLRVVEDIIEFTGPVQNRDGTTASAVSGDSGSPYIVTQNGRNCVAGVHSRRPPELMIDNPPPGPSPGDTHTGIGANLHNLSSRVFLVGQLRGLDCDIYEANCPAWFAALHRSVYRRLPATATTTMFDVKLRRNQTTLWQIASGLREALLLIWWP
jgi:hypothetical protein